MSEAIEKFAFEGNQVRVVMQNDEPWFVAKDVCDILGTRTDHVKDIIGDKRVMSIDPLTVGDNGRGHGKGILVVSESGLYKLIMVSRKPEAVKFQDWVTDDVLPTIRKTGAYSIAKPTACQHAVTCTPRNLAESLRMLADEYEAHELTIGVLNETTTQRDEALNTIEEQKSHIKWIDQQRLDMNETVCKCAPLKKAPSDDSILVRAHWREESKKADGVFDKSQNNHYISMVRRAIKDKCLMDYELEEFKTVMKADEIKGTKHTKDECVLLEMYNNGHVSVSTTFIGGAE